jgi:general secretion pathway protein G
MDERRRISRAADVMLAGDAGVSSDGRIHTGRRGPARDTPRQDPTAFTLVELLVVIAILGILMSLVTAGAQTARRRGAVTKAKAMIGSLETAIAMYEADMGEYPATGNDALVAALQDDPDDANWGGPYLEFKEEELEDGVLLDPWGQPYEYVSVNGGSPAHRERSFDLYSFGPNGDDDSGTGDDIYNW